MLARLLVIYKNPSGSSAILIKACYTSLITKGSKPLSLVSKSINFYLKIIKINKLFNIC